jgi:very-short-patch-repair endonuclease
MSTIWSPKNSILPRNVIKGSDAKYLFDCDVCHHEITMSLRKIIAGHGCSFCAKKLLCDNKDCQWCFKNSFASSEKAKFWSSKNTLQPRSIMNGSNEQFWFNCETCKHEFQMKLRYVKQGCWCQICAGKVRCIDENCKYCFNKSFASHPKSKYWSKKNNISPRFVAGHAAVKYCFDCDVCKHEFWITPSDVHHNFWCSFCANKQLCSDINCDYCFKKSFASCEKANWWSEKNKLSAREVFAQSDKRFIFKCTKCFHEFDTSLNNVFNNGCAFCANQNMCFDNNCQYCYNKSFATSDRAAYLIDQNPRYLFKFSNKKYSFSCKEGHRFDASLSNVSLGKWCPLCRNKSEAKVLEFLSTRYVVQSQYKEDWCKNIHHLPFDILLKDLNVIIEIDGRQHFEQIGSWTAPEITRVNDVYKIQMAIEHGFTIIHIPQEYIYDDRNPWKMLLINAIEKHKGSNTSIFINTNDEYKIHHQDCPNSIYAIMTDYV